MRYEKEQLDYFISEVSISSRNRDWSRLDSIRKQMCYMDTDQKRFIDDEVKKYLAKFDLRHT